MNKRLLAVIITLALTVLVIFVVWTLDGQGTVSTVVAVLGLLVSIVELAYGRGEQLPESKNSSAFRLQSSGMFKKRHISSSSTEFRGGIFQEHKDP